MAPQVLELTQNEAGKIYQAIFRYACYGKETDFSQDDRFVRSLWETTKMKIEAGEIRNKEISETNRNNVMKRWQGKNSDTTVYDGIQSNKSDTTVYDGTTITDSQRNGNAAKGQFVPLPDAELWGWRLKRYWCNGE